MKTLQNTLSRGEVAVTKPKKIECSENRIQLKLTNFYGNTLEQVFLHLCLQAANHNAISVIHLLHSTTAE